MFKNIACSLVTLFVSALVVFIVFGAIKLAPIYGKDLSWHQIKEAWNRGNIKNNNNREMFDFLKKFNNLHDTQPLSEDEKAFLREQGLLIENNEKGLQ